MKINKTKTLDTLFVTKSKLDEIKEDKFDKLFQQRVDELEKDFRELCEVVDKYIATNTKIYMEQLDVYYIPSIVAIIPNEKQFKCSKQSSGDKWKLEGNWNNRFGNLIFTGVLPTNVEIQKIPVEWRNIDSDNFGYITLDNGIFYAYTGYFYSRASTLHGWRSESVSNRFIVLGDAAKRNDCEDWRSPHSALPIFRLNGVNSSMVSGAQTLLLWLEYGLELAKTETWFTEVEGIKKTWKYLKAIYAEHKEYLIADDNSISLDKIKIKNDAKQGINPTVLGFDAVSIFSDDIIDADEDYIKNFEDSFLNCDSERACIDKYDRKLLNDINRGHWDLWDYNETIDGIDSVYKVSVPKGLIARDPHFDVQDGLVAIDFGTKSTVVVYGEGSIKNKLLQVGNGNYDSAEKNKYENPTVMRFIDLDNFMKAYKQTAGRPRTSWNDLTVSHEAFKDMLATDRACYDSFVDNLKQWCCGAYDEKLKLKDSQKTFEIAPFMELTSEEFNPVEIYAYYIGSYINNMLGVPKIYKHYIMSFPVTFDHGVREKILRSFRAGLAKSLPTALVNDNAFMETFIVEEGATEPAAYAATAMSEYDPQDEQTCYYGVFDFGGGTTDFDFGLYRDSSSDRYDYDLIHFGANGDRTLGGENLLRKLAFEVFKFNRKNLRVGDKKIPFNWDPDFTDFNDSNDYIESSQVANQNMHNLMEKLRYVWEAPDSDEATKILESGSEGFPVTLFDTEGNQNLNFKLYLVKPLPPSQLSKTAETDSEQNNTEEQEEPSVEESNMTCKLDLQKIIEERIESGVKKFFLTMKEAFNNGVKGNSEEISRLEDVRQFTILLAGNSCKAKIVKEIFERYTGQNLAAQILGIEDNKISFIIKEPLGLDSDDISKPNGKTGVAFGLIKCRKGGEDTRIINVAPNNNKIAFQYYVGRSRKKKFKTYVSPNSKLNEWVKFIDASDDFEIYYTNDARALDEKSSIEIAQGVISVLLDESQKSMTANVYICPLDSHRLAWKIASNEEELKNNSIEPKVIDFQITD